MNNHGIATTISRTEVEDFLFKEAALLDEWRLDEWLELLTDDAGYYIPPNDALEANHLDTLFIIADDHERLKSRVKRLKSRHAHAENPKSRTKRFISNVRITDQTDQTLKVSANFIVYRFRRNEDVRTYVGSYEYTLLIENGELKIAERRVKLATEELGSLGAVSILL